MAKLPYRIDRAGFSATLASEHDSRSVSGGFSRIRRDSLLEYYSVGVQWVLSESDYGAFLDFYFDGTEEGKTSFLIDLLIDSFTTQEYEATFIPNSVKLVNIEGHKFTVQATLEVKPQPVDSDADNALLDLYDFGTGEDLISALSIFVNVTTPNAIEYDV